MAIESFSMLTFNEGIGIALHRKDVDKVAAQDVFLVFSLEEIPLDQKYVVAPRERKGEVEAGERRIKIKRISVKDVYISYRRRELVVGGKLAAEARAGLNLGSMVGVLNRELKLNFNMAGNMGHMGTTGGGHLALGGVRKKIDFSSMGSAGSGSSALASPGSPSRASSPASRKTVDPSSPSAGTKRKIDDKENEPNGSMTSSPSRGSPARGSALTPVKSSTSPAKRARPSPLRVKLEQTTAPAASSPLASASALPSSSVALPSASVASVPVSVSLPSAVAHVPARVAPRTKPRPSVSMGLLDLLPTPPPAAAVASAPPAAAAPAPAPVPSRLHTDVEHVNVIKTSPHSAISSTFKTTYVYTVPTCVQMSVVPLNHGLHMHTHSNVPFIHWNLCLSTTPTMMPLIKHLLSITFPQTLGHCKTQSPQEYAPNSSLKNSPILMTTLVC